MAFATPTAQQKDLILTSVKAQTPNNPTTTAATDTPQTRRQSTKELGISKTQRRIHRRWAEELRTKVGAAEIVSHLRQKMATRRVKASTARTWVGQIFGAAKRDPELHARLGHQLADFERELAQRSWEDQTAYPQEIARHH